MGTEQSPLHRGRPGLWANSVILSVATILIGVCFAFDGKRVTGSPAYDQARSVMRAVGVPNSQTMRAWGAVFTVLGVVALVPLTRRSTSMTKGECVAPAAVLWMAWAAMFATYAAAHDGLGLVGAVIWAAVAGCMFTASFVYFRHARTGNGW